MVLPHPSNFHMVCVVITLFVVVKHPSKQFFQLCWNGVTAFLVLPVFADGKMCLAQGHNTEEVGFEPPTSRYVV